MSHLLPEPSEAYRAGIRVNSNVVRRPYSDWSNEVHKLLDYVASMGFDAAPLCLYIDKDDQGQSWEVMTLVEGDTYDFPLKGPIATPAALESAASLLKQFHIASRRYLAYLQKSTPEWQNIQWMLPAREPAEIICHGDFSPYNLALTGNTVTGVFDFDTAHPGPAIWDVAFTVYCFAPFKTDSNDCLGSLKQQIQRAKRFCDSYGLDDGDRLQLVTVMQNRVQALVDFMRSSQGSDYGNGAQLQSYINDIHYLQRNQHQITQGLIGSAPQTKEGL